MASNQAAWFDAVGKTLEVRSADVPKPEADEIIVKAHSVAINPVDWKMQHGYFLANVELPFVMGHDIAGEIFEVGSSVKSFEKGDRVLA